MYPTVQKRLQAELEEIRNAGLYKEERVLTSPQGSTISVGGKDVLCLCANNYLGLSNDPELVEAAGGALQEYGLGLSTICSATKRKP